MSEKAMLRVICYDIALGRDRRKVAAALEEVAARVQYSVYEARLTHSEAGNLMDRLALMVDHGDSLRLYTIPDRMMRHCLQKGGVQSLGAGQYWIV